MAEACDAVIDLTRRRGDGGTYRVFVSTASQDEEQDKKQRESDGLLEEEDVE